MKAIIDNKKTYEVTGERGDFWICKDGNKVKMFAKKNVEVVEVEKIEAPKFKKAISRPLTDEQIRRRQINHITEWLPSLVADGGAKEFLNDVKEAANSEVVTSIVNYAFRRNMISGKQAYVIAVNAIENNVELNVNKQ